MLRFALAGLVAFALLGLILLLLLSKIATSEALRSAKALGSPDTESSNQLFPLTYWVPPIRLLPASGYSTSWSGLGCFPSALSE